MKLVRYILVGCLLGSFAGSEALQLAQRRRPGASTPEGVAPHRTRLILKDGSYQVVMSYKVVGSRVRFVSAERAGDVEEIPLSLVDLEATKRWENQHTVSEPGQEKPVPALDPELLKEEADRAALAPEVAPDLRLSPENTVLALDTYRGTPELVPLTQSESDLNKATGHNVLRAMINPLASAHQLIQLKGEKAAVQIHVDEPALYLRLDDDQPSSGEALTVDTHGATPASPRNAKKSQSEYVIVRVDVRQDTRIVASFNTSALGSVRRQDDVIQTTSIAMPGGHWLKITPKDPLLIGEYALMEILGPKEVNLGVWDFGVHPTAPENRDVLRPEKRRAVRLEKRQD